MNTSLTTAIVSACLVATMSALLLGLLVNSAKTSYDTTRIQVIQRASSYALLDRLLVIYGPRAAEVRGELPALIEESTRRMGRASPLVACGVNTPQAQWLVY